MKKHITYILAAFSIFAAMSLVSCEKETYTPVQTKQEPVTTPAKKETVYSLGYYRSPLEFLSGDDETVTAVLHTNIPGAQLIFESEPWIAASYKGTTDTDGVVEITVTASRNEDQHLREGKLTVRDAGGRVAPVTVPLSQSYVIVTPDGMVRFQDKAFKTAMLELADRDGDGQVSQDEADAVQEIDITGRGVKDLTGLDAFKNTWKLDARNNDIEDAMIVSELHYLHWLSLKGNKNLKCFDVRGCTSYFEVCDYEVTEDLNYYLYYRYMGVTWPDDKYCKHSHHSRDPRETQDWSREGECYEVYHHTEGPGKMAVVFSGIGWIDVDVNDGTFERIIHQGMELLKEQPDWKDKWPYFDVYVYIHMAEKRCQWMYWDELIGHEGPEEIALKDAYREHRKNLFAKMEKAVPNKYCYKITIDNHSVMGDNAVTSSFPEWVQIAPINGYDNKNESFYNYYSIDKALKEIEILCQIGLYYGTDLYFD